MARGGPATLAIALIPLLILDFDSTASLPLDIASLRSEPITRPNQNAVPATDGEAQLTVVKYAIISRDTQPRTENGAAKSSVKRAGKSWAEDEFSRNVADLGPGQAVGPSRRVRVLQRPITHVCYFSPIQCVFYEMP